MHVTIVMKASEHRYIACIQANKGNITYVFASLDCLIVRCSEVEHVTVVMQSSEHIYISNAHRQTRATSHIWLRLQCQYWFVGCSEVEHQLQGSGPWQLPDGSSDIELIHVPGHTEGSIVLLYKPGKALFSGDHFGVSWRFNRLVTYT